MPKVFNTTAVCIPKEHYMVNLDERLKKSKYSWMLENILRLTGQDNTERLRRFVHCIFICRENIMWFQWTSRLLGVPSFRQKQFFHVLCKFLFEIVEKKSGQ